MTHYDTIDVSEGTDINKTYASNECDICHYWYFLDQEFKFQPFVWNCCHDVLVMAMNLSDIATLNINGVDYCCIINESSKSEVINLLQIADLNVKAEHYKIKKIFSSIKIGKEILTCGDIKSKKHRLYPYKSPIFLGI